MTKPRCDTSIIIPVYNTSVFHIKRALISASLQDRSYLREIIVYDDASSQACSNQIENEIQRLKIGVPILYYRGNEHLGIGGARNKAINKASGQFALLLDSDDELLEGALLNCRESMKNGVNIVYSNHEVIDMNGVNWLRDKSIYHDLHLRYWGTPFDPIIHRTFVVQCQMIRISAFYEIGGYPEHAAVGEHSWIIPRLAYKSFPGSLTFVPKKLYRHYWYSNSTYLNKLITHRDSVCGAFFYAARFLGIDISRVQFIDRFAPYKVSHYQFILKDGDHIQCPYLDYDQKQLHNAF